VNDLWGWSPVSGDSDPLPLAGFTEGEASARFRGDVEPRSRVTLANLHPR
jgi:hypothetical protein